MKHRINSGGLAESVVAHLLRSHGVRILARNVEVDGGEVDIVGVDQGTSVAFEVRSRTRGDARDAFDESKARQVRRLADALGLDRVDLVAVELRADRVDVRWMPGWR